MKRQIFIAAFLLLFSYDQAQTKQAHQDNAVLSDAPHCISAKDAEKILGEAAVATENTSEEKDGYAKYKCTYTAKAQPAGTDRLSNVFYLFEKYTSIKAAQKVYSDIIASNEGMSGQEKLELGDEALLHSDGSNFLLIMVRKGDKIVRIKVNKVTGKTSQQALKDVMKEITLTL